MQNVSNKQNTIQLKDNNFSNTHR